MERPEKILDTVCKSLRQVQKWNEPFQLSFFPHSVIPEGCSKVWMGPTRQTLALLYWALSGTSTILSICLQEQPAHPFGTALKSVREGLEWSRLPMSISLNGSKQHKWWGAGGGAQITFLQQETRSTGAANKTFSDRHSLPPSLHPECIGQTSLN